ncbi:MAG: C39 family peptidase [Leptospirales bacterium]
MNSLLQEITETIVNPHTGTTPTVVPDKGGRPRLLTVAMTLLTFFSILLTLPKNCPAGVIFFNSVPTGVLTVRAQSYKELKFRDVVRQEYDFSCGSAAVATLLTFGYLRPTSETEAFEAMYKAGDKKKIEKHGFSLLDIKQYLASLGYKSDGFRLPLQKLMDLRLPAIVLIEVNGYKHFVVIKGLSDQNVLIGDPAMGLRMDTRSHFKTLWQNGIVFVIHEGPDILITQKTFNNPHDWEIVNVSVPSNVVQNSLPLTTQLLVVPGPNQFQLGGFAKIGIP